ncbi:hypothetical protein CEXT_663831 [Caerostris extrusa]|uniref:Uncharacterized protein n=1 Tax=Caerostris extrusa TaxID=172846 RepID=A0AAV4M4X5_CAEEX|nr:hypothetical protein CEXT_663831 [Caerostris extrusa]
MIFMSKKHQFAEVMKPLMILEQSSALFCSIRILPPFVNLFILYKMDSLSPMSICTGFRFLRVQRGKFVLFFLCEVRTPSLTEMNGVHCPICPH